MKKKKILYSLLLVLQLAIIFCIAVIPVNTAEKVWTQDQLLCMDENGEKKPGFYLNASPDADDSVYIETEAFRLNRGRYRINIKYENVGGGKIRLLYEDGRYGKDLSGNLLLKEDLQEMTFDVRVTDKDRDLVIRGFQRQDRNDQDYLLIREIGIRTADNARGIRIAVIAGIFLLIDFLFFLFTRWNLKGIIRENAMLIAVFGITIFFTSLPLFISYLPSEMLDIRFHITRIEGLREGLLSGAFPVRIQPGWLNGHGYAVSVFYGDLFLYFPAVLTLLGVSLQTAYQCFALSVNIVTIWIAFYCCRKMTGSKNIAMFGAVLYTGNLYRLTAMYMRAAVGAYCAMTFFPLIVLGLWEIYKQNESEGKTLKKGWIPLVIGFSGILESHIISFEMTVVFTALLCLILWEKTFQKTRFFTLCKAVGITIGLNLWFLIPFLDYLRDDFNINSKDAYIGDHYKLQERGLLLPQIFASDFEVVSASKDVSTGIQGEMPLSIGIAMTMVFVAGILLWAYKWEKREKRKEVVLCMGLTAFSFLLTLSCFPYIQLGRIIPYSQMVFRSIQYSWRFLTISIVLLLWMFCLIGIELERRDKKLFQFAAAAICTICILQAIDFSSDVLNNMGTLEFHSGANLDMTDIGGGEYLPLNTDVDVLKDRITSTEAIEVGEWKRDYNRISCEIYNQTGEKQELELPLLFYRYYRAEENGSILPVGRAESGRLCVQVPAFYDGTVNFFFREPLLWRGAEFITCLTAVWIICQWMRRKNKGSQYQMF